MSKFRNPDGGPRYTKALFFESYLDPKIALYSLKDQDHNGYPSLYRLYMEEDDLTEYKFAYKYFDGWDHWMSIANASWFKDYITSWRKDLAMRKMCQLQERVESISKSGGKEALSASRVLLERLEKLMNQTTKRGRPLKTQSDEELAREEKISNKQIETDYKRVMN